MSCSDSDPRGHGCTSNRPATRSTTVCLLAALVSCLGILFQGSLTPVSAQLPGIELGSLNRGGGQVGTEFDVQVASGNQIEEIDRLWFSDPSIQSEPVTPGGDAESEDANESPRRFRVTLPAELAPGRYEVRLVGRSGVSNPRIFLATEQPWLIPPSIGHRLEEATAIDVESIVAAQASAEQVDWFAIELAADERVTLRLQAQSLDSALIGQLTLLDSKGRRIEAARGADDFDPELSFTTSAEGEYFVCVHDVLFRGGPEYAYLLSARIGESEQPEPLAAVADSPALVTAEAQVPSPHRPEAAGIVAPPTEVALSPKATAASPLELPHTIVGHFETRGKPDSFEFIASEDQQLQIDVTSQRFGEPADPFWWIEREVAADDGARRWERVQTADDSQEVGDAALPLRTADPSAIVAIKAGRHRLRLRDLDTGRSLRPEKMYRLFLGPPQADFQLVAYRPFPHQDINQSRPLGSRLLPSGTEAIRVFVLRQGGWTGEIELTVEGLPDGVRCPPAVLAANQTTTQLTLVAEEEAASGVFEPRVVGRATVDDQEVSRTAIAATIQRGRGGGREFIRSRLSSQLAAAVTEGDPIPLVVEFGEDDAAEIQPGGSLSLPIQIQRREGGQAACVVRPRDLPPGVTAAEVTIPAEQSDGTLELKAADNAAAGTYSIWAQTETKLKWNDQEFTAYLPSPHLTIQVTDTP